ncbi:MAG TPA: MBL fold metallo-hydrolase [Microlunatus sp.]|nr:MBL fold metallo-hydrolase [Microlunatus sp.]
MLDQSPDPIILVVKRAGDVRIHTVISSFAYNNIANATHIIESANKLVLVDGQFLVPYAKKFRSYADSLGKPIDRLYLSHRHPDHWFGLGAAFTDVPVYALAETRDFLQEHGEDSRNDHWKLGDLVADTVAIPQEVVEAGTEDTIDGVSYIFDKVTETEIDFHLTIQLPDLGVYVAQDLLYSGTHLYLTQQMGHWIKVLAKMLTSDYDLFLPGHGLPADKNEVANNVEYLTAARDAIGDGLTNEAFRDFMLTRYPQRRCPGIFDIYLPRLFGSASDY